MIGCICCHGPLDDKMACPRCDFSDLAEPQSAPMGEQELIALADRIRDYQFQKRSPLLFIARERRMIEDALRAAASPRLVGREEIARIINPSAFDKNPDPDEPEFWRKAARVLAQQKADAILSLLGPAPSESVPVTKRKD